MKTILDVPYAFTDLAKILIKENEIKIANEHSYLLKWYIDKGYDAEEIEVTLQVFNSQSNLYLYINVKAEAGGTGITHDIIDWSNAINYLAKRSDYTKEKNLAIDKIVAFTNTEKEKEKAEKEAEEQRKKLEKEAEEQKLKDEEILLRAWIKEKGGECVKLNMKHGYEFRYSALIEKALFENEGFDNLNNGNSFPDAQRPNCKILAAFDKEHRKNNNVVLTWNGKNRTYYAELCVKYAGIRIYIHKALTV